MGTKPVLAVAGALLTGVVLSGCESGRPFYDGPRSYMPIPGQAAASYSPAPGWYTQKPMSGGIPVGTSAMSMKAEPTHVGAPDPSSSMQLASGTAGTPAATGTPTPMLTITMPAVKFLVPINGTYSFNQGGATPTTGGMEAAQAPRPLPMVTADGHAMRANTPAAPTMQYQAPTIQYVLPTVNGPSAGAPTVQYLPAPTQPMPSSPRTGIPRMVDETVPAARPVLTPPPPSWPQGIETIEEASTDLAVPPPPPPIHRGSAAGAPVMSGVPY